MNALDIRVVSKMIDPMKQLKRRITLKDMTKMSLEEIENEVKELKAIIEKGEVDSYTVNTFTTLCGKAIEELNIYPSSFSKYGKVYVDKFKGGELYV